MSERILFSSEERNEKLIEWRDPVGKATEWVTEGELETKVLFRWEGCAGVNATLFPGTMTIHNSWFIDLTAIQRTLDYCTTVWKSDETRGLWLTECQGWFPDRDWTVEGWKNAFLRAVLPWLSRSDPWLSFRQSSFADELKPLFQAPSLEEGLPRAGFSQGDHRVSNRVKQSILASMGETGVSSPFMVPVLWSARLLPWLNTDELLSFWEPPMTAEQPFPYLLFRFKPYIFKKLMDAVKTSPDPHDWWFDLILLDSPIGRRGRGKRDRAIKWLDQLRWFYENSAEGWTTRLPRNLGEVRAWEVALGSPTVLGSWTYGRSILVGLFDRRKLVAVSEWADDNALIRSVGNQEAPLTVELHQRFRELLPWVTEKRLKRSRWDLRA